jgi:hypothetical protein
MKSPRVIFFLCFVFTLAAAWGFPDPGSNLPKTQERFGKVFDRETTPEIINEQEKKSQATDDNIPKNKENSEDAEYSEGAEYLEENEEQEVIPPESALQIYQREFEEADIPVKINMLISAAMDEELAEDLGLLNETALQFALQNSESLGNDPQMLQLISTTARSAANYSFNDNFDTLWDVFCAYNDFSVRMEILAIVSRFGGDNHSVPEKLNGFLSGQNDHYRSGKHVDYPLVSAIIDVIARLGDNSSFPALFSVITSGYPEVLAFEAAGALEMISGDYKQFLIEVMTRNPPYEKAEAFKMGMNSDRLTFADKGQIAELALELSLIPGGENDAALSSMRYSSILALTDLRWTMASDLAVRHYYRVQTDYQRGLAGKDRLLEAIACLNAIGNSRAALALALHLGLMNAQTERTGTFDEDITLAVVQALGRIGDKSAFDYLAYMNSLNYPDHIQDAAMDALGRLRW